MNMTVPTGEKFMKYLLNVSHYKMPCPRTDRECRCSTTLTLICWWWLMWPKQLTETLARGHSYMRVRRESYPMNTNMTRLQRFSKIFAPLCFGKKVISAFERLILLVINCFGVWYNLYLAIRWLYHPRRSRGWYSLLIARYKLYHTPKQLITNLSHDCLLDLCTGNKNEHTYIHTNTRRLIQDSERLIQLHITCQLTNQKPRILPIMR